MWEVDLDYILWARHVPTAMACCSGDVGDSSTSLACRQGCRACLHRCGSGASWELELCHAMVEGVPRMQYHLPTIASIRLSLLSCFSRASASPSAEDQLPLRSLVSTPILHVSPTVHSADSVYIAAGDIKGHEEIGYELGLYGGHTIAWSEIKAARREAIESDPQVLVSESQTFLPVVFILFTLIR